MSLRKAAALFMSTTLGGLKSQVNTSYRFLSIFECTHIIPEQHTTIFLVYKHAVRKLEKGKKFFLFLETEAWPDELNALRHKMPDTSIMDDFLMEKSRNETYILYSLLERFGPHCPMKAKRLIEKSRAEWRGGSTRHGDTVNSNASNGAQGNESHRSICHLTENSTSN